MFLFGKLIKILRKYEKKMSALFDIVNKDKW